MINVVSLIGFNRMAAARLARVKTSGNILPITVNRTGELLPASRSLIRFEAL